MIASTDIATTRFILRWRGSGIIVVALFGAMWANWARPLLMHAPAIIILPAIMIVFAITGALLLAGMSLRRQGSRLPDASDNTSSAARNRISRGFWLVVLGEVLALNIAAYFLMGHGLVRFLPAAVAIVVGLHFFPLARLFRARHYNITGTVMTLAGIVATVAMLSGSPAVPTDSLSDLACALALWGSGFFTWHSTRKAFAERVVVAPRPTTTA